MTKAEAARRLCEVRAEVAKALNLLPATLPPTLDEQIRSELSAAIRKLTDVITGLQAGELRRLRQASPRER